MWWLDYLKRPARFTFVAPAAVRAPDCALSQSEGCVVFIQDSLRGSLPPPQGPLELEPSQNTVAGESAVLLFLSVF